MSSKINAIPIEKLKISDCPIGKLSDADLAQIFENLPLYDRLRASEVLRRWRDVSRRLWLDVRHADISAVPSRNLGAVVRQCPNLESVFALRQTFKMANLKTLGHVPLRSAKLYDCTLIADDESYYSTFEWVFAGNAPAGLEIVLHGVSLVDPRPRRLRTTPLTSPLLFPPALKRLQLCLPESKASMPQADEFLFDLGELQNLECLILYGTFYEQASFRAKFCETLATLKNLKELCLVWPELFEESFEENRIGTALMKLPKLEVLMLNDAYFSEEDLSEIVTKHPTLRILMLTGTFWSDELDVEVEIFDDGSQFLPPAPEISIPARFRFPNGFEAAPLPLLNICLSEDASEILDFAPSASEAAKIYEIRESTPYFLEREDVKAIFEDVWVAKMNKEGAQHGARLWDYDYDDPNLRPQEQDYF